MCMYTGHSYESYDDVPGRRQPRRPSVRHGIVTSVIGGSGSVLPAPPAARAVAQQLMHHHAANARLVGTRVHACCR